MVYRETYITLFYLCWQTLPRRVEEDREVLPVACCNRLRVSAVPRVSAAPGGEPSDRPNSSRSQQGKLSKGREGALPADCATRRRRRLCSKIYQYHTGSRLHRRTSQRRNHAERAAAHILERQILRRSVCPDRPPRQRHMVCKHMHQSWLLREKDTVRLQL